MHSRDYHSHTRITRGILFSVVCALVIGCTSACTPSHRTIDSLSSTASDASVVEAALPTPILPSEDAEDRVVIPPFDEATLANTPAVDSFPALVPTDDPPLGTSAPNHIWYAAPDGHWAVVCEARSDTNGDGKLETGTGQHGEILGDALKPYLVMGSGAGELLDDFVASTRDGRWIAFVRKGKLILRDTLGGGHDEDLSARGADSSTDNSPLFGHRAGSFDESGVQFQYLRRSVSGTTIVVRQLLTGDESLIGVGRDSIDRSYFLGDGHWVAARVVLYKPGRRGHVKPARGYTSLAMRRCRGNVGSGSFGGGSTGELTVEHIARLGRDSELMAPPGKLITAIGARLLLRQDDEALIVFGEDKSVREWVPASCRGVVAAVASMLDRALVGCKANGESEMHAEIAGDAGRKPLHLTISAELTHESRIRVGSKVSISEFRKEFQPIRTLNFKTGEIAEEIEPYSY